MFQMKEQDEASEKDLNEIDISDLLYKEFKIMIVKMLRELWRRMMNAVRTVTEESGNIKKKSQT